MITFQDRPKKTKAAGEGSLDMLLFIMICCFMAPIGAVTKPGGPGTAGRTILALLLLLAIIGACFGAYYFFGCVTVEHVRIACGWLTVASMGALGWRLCYLVLEKVWK